MTLDTDMLRSLASQARQFQENLKAAKKNHDRHVKVTLEYIDELQSMIRVNTTEIRVCDGMPKPLMEDPRAPILSHSPPSAP
jgi:tRNA isopentenyl-2-thiomethyl-A-37 hydroxylase MiaE